MKLKRKLLGLAISSILIVPLNGCGVKVTPSSIKTSGKVTVDKKRVH